ncbi:MAG: tryptophan synthase alpha chain [Gammaproteobacteria bacterium]|jgi:tryptophan synthase alpha chain
MNDRIKNCFAALQARNKCALVTYVTAGDPSAQVTLNLMRTMVEAGADIIELGVPFSDPMADGPVIQRASERALNGGMSLNGVLEVVRQFRLENSLVPIILMGYLNPLEAMGYEKFSELASAAGVDGALVVDVPPEESSDLNHALASRGLDQIFLIAPTSTRARIESICAVARGFVYYVAVKGVTGTKDIDTEDVSSRIQEFRRMLPLPIGVGFGIKSPESAAKMALAGDAVIVGSAIIEIIERHQERTETMYEEITLFIESLRAALDDARAE